MALHINEIETVNTRVVVGDNKVSITVEFTVGLNRALSHLEWAILSEWGGQQGGLSISGYGTGTRITVAVEPGDELHAVKRLDGTLPTVESRAEMIEAEQESAETTAWATLNSWLRSPH